MFNLVDESVFPAGRSSRSVLEYSMAVELFHPGRIRLITQERKKGGDNNE